MRRIFVVLVFVGAAVVSTPGTGVASAAKATNCAFFLHPVGTDRASRAIEAVPVALGCFSTFAEALTVGSNGAIEVSGETTPPSLTDATLQRGTFVEPDTSVLIGTEWTSTGYTGSSNSYFASSTCTSSTTWQVNYVGDAWNDSFESGKGFGGCDTNKKYHDADYGGAVLTCTPNCSDYGSLKNQVSSLKWRI